MSKPLLSIACLTFNHSKFIEQCLDSFFEQVCDFKFEIIIGDGGSKDNNREILKSYQEKYGSEKIKLLLPNKDPGIGGMLNAIFTECQGKYIAVCEGDDFWVDKTKIARHISLLEQNEKLVLVHSEIGFVDMQGNSIVESEAHKNIVLKRKNGLVFDSLMSKGNFLYTPTVCFRSSALNKKTLENVKTWFLFDLWYWLQISINGEFYFDNSITSMYRRHPEGATQTHGFFNGKYRALHFDIIKSSYKKKIEKKHQLAIVQKIIFYTKSNLTFNEFIIILRILINRPVYWRLGFQYWRKRKQLNTLASKQ